MLTELAPVPSGDLPVAALRDHLRLGQGFADDGLQDGLLAGFLRAAIAAVEARISRALLRRGFRWTLDDWPRPDAVFLPIGPVAAITALSITDASGAEFSHPETSWRLSQEGGRPRLTGAGGWLPMVPRGGHLRLDFTAGHGADWAGVPADLAQAVMVLAAHFHEYRLGAEPAARDRLPQDLPFGVTALTDHYRLRRLGGIGSGGIGSGGIGSGAGGRK